MEFREIVECIKKWQQCRSNADKLLAYFKQGNAFRFTFQPGSGDTGNAEYLHAYPGINGDSLVFFLLPAHLDSVQHADEIALYTQVCTVQRIISSGLEISPEEAKRRIAYWEERSSYWIPEQVNTEEGIYQAFVIPVSGLSVDKEYNTYFALEQQKAEKYTADLILWDLIWCNAFFDTVRPVPPFKDYRKREFYLLGISENP